VHRVELRSSIGVSFLCCASLRVMAMDGVLVGVRHAVHQASTGSGCPTRDEAGMPKFSRRRIIGMVSGRFPFSTS
jgi:hypothetical protein